MNETSGISVERVQVKRVSSLLLERYRLGEVTYEERKLVEDELSLDSALLLRYGALEESDRELRRLYPLDSFQKTRNAKKPSPPRRGPRRLVWGAFEASFFLRGACAAALFLCVLLPSLYYLRGRASDEKSSGGTAARGIDRVKGALSNHELSIYLMGSAPGEEHRLEDSVPLGEGSTVQLAYLISPGEDRYGVIFSIDGRSSVTLHYPYSAEQSNTLTAGKRTFLSEAYTLDDAPELEIFFMVVSPEKLETEDILKSAEELARDPRTAAAKSAALFSGCEVEIITIKKE